MEIVRRKEDHIRISLEENVIATRNHWDDVHLPHRALPKTDLENVQLKTVLLGKELAAPIVIASMTGGSPQAKKYNEMLAKAASEFQIAMGVGSQRAGIEDTKLRQSYDIVKEYDIPLVFGNLGAPQFSNGIEDGKYGIDEIRVAVDMINADAICIHLNYLQEVVQPEGDNYIIGFREVLKQVTSEFVIVAKETGGGISRKDALELDAMGVAAIDVGGMSGTTFSGIESYRHDPKGRSERLGRTFWDWGIPTPISLKWANVGIPLIGTGGLRNGLDIAKALSLGASAGGMARHLLKAASVGYDELVKEISMIIEELRAAVFLAGKGSSDDLKYAEPVITGLTAELLRGYEK